MGGIGEIEVETVWVRKQRRRRAARSIELDLQSRAPIHDLTQQDQEATVPLGDLVGVKRDALDLGHRFDFLDDLRQRR